MTSWTDLHKLVISGEFEEEQFLDYTHLINIRTQTGSSALHLAAMGGDQRIILFLIRKGAQVNCINNAGETPLHWACKAGRTSIIKLLLKAGANIDAIDLEGNTALHWAAEYNSHRIIKVLLLKGAKQTKNERQQTPREVAEFNLSSKAQRLFSREEAAHFL